MSSNHSSNKGKNISVFHIIWVVLCKELLDLFRDRRTLLLTVGLGPVVFPLLMIGMATLGEKRAREQIQKPLELPVIGAEYAPNLMDWLKGQNVVIKDPPADIDASIAKQEYAVILRLNKDYSEQWKKSQPAPLELLFDSTRQDSQIPISRLQALLGGYSGQIGSLRLLSRGVNPGTSTALQIRRTDLASLDAQRSRFLAALLPYFLILSSFIGGAALIMDATAGERERQSLEPLLATPAQRGALVSGKIAAAAIVALLTLTLTLIGFKISALLSPSIGRQMEVSFLAIFKLLITLVPMVLIGTTLLTFLSATSKSMKEAQSHMSWLMFLPMLPTIVLMVNPVKEQMWQFAVPFLSQNQMILKIVRGEFISPAQWGIYLGCSFALAAILWVCASRRYQNEQLAISG